MSSLPLSVVVPSCHAQVNGVFTPGFFHADVAIWQQPSQTVGCAQDYEDVKLVKYLNALTQLFFIQVLKWMLHVSMDTFPLTI